MSIKQTISPVEIEEMAKKLDKLGSQLSDNERALLVAVFGMASSAISDATKKVEEHLGAPVAGKLNKPDQFDLGKSETGKLPPLSQAFKESFSPGTAGRFALEGGNQFKDSVDVSVGGICVSVSWSKDL
ncbi:hypothetical protein ATI61_11883 [Archangium gephyra]|uniref:Uncharacterized protein n=1 Tax=Archangium gephyra TaxID=48 RepID=A0AAC8Q9V7_9BACT|nr:hypothetical protein [Archangium gephyra]AKJ03248.1 Hypothetical protein AA314_04874 [Archangium gephyra]REG22878.1 hypothetical protein ATI61_11883 [Archangium gephyra]